jgi:rod shape-determining protein MreD
MIYCFYVAACLCLVVLQTTILSNLPLLNKIYDLLIPFVIYLGLFRPIREGLIFALFLGFIMDNLSGSPFGLYLTTYCWLFIGVKWTTTIVHVTNRLLLSLVVAAGVLLENFIFLAAFAILSPQAQLPAGAGSTVAIQTLWALGTGTIFLVFFRHCQERLDDLMHGIMGRRNNAGF